MQSLDLHEAFFLFFYDLLNNSHFLYAEIVFLVFTILLLLIDSTFID